MNRLLGTAPNQITEEEKKLRLDNLYDKLIAALDKSKEDQTGEWMKPYGEVQKELVALQRNYPDLPPESGPIIVVSVRQECHACPTSWTGKTIDDKEVYARYRWGYLSVEVDDRVVYGRQLDYGEDDREWMDEKMNSSDELLKMMNGGFSSYAGDMDYHELIEHTQGWLAWPILE